MKRLFVISFAVFLVLILVVTVVLYNLDDSRGIMDSEAGESRPTETFAETDILTPVPENKDDLVLETGDNYTIESIRDADHPLDRYLTKIYSEEGKLIGEVKSRLDPKIIRTTWNGEDVIGIRDSAGTGLACRYVNFFRLSDGVKSESFYYYLDVGHGLVVLGELDGVLVRDIFDENGYSKKFDTFSVPYAHGVIDCFDARLSEDGEYVEITYRTKDADGNYGTNTEIFPLNR